METVWFSNFWRYAYTVTTRLGEKTITGLSPFFISIILLLSPVFTGMSQGTQLWIDADTFTPALQTKALLSIGQGEGFPDSHSREREEFFSLSCVLPDGTIRPISYTTAAQTYQAALLFEEPGTYILHAAVKNLLMIRTGQGWVKGKAIDGQAAYRQVLINRSAKTFIRGGGKSTPDHTTVFGDALEIIPLQNPDHLRAGDNISIKVLFLGKIARNMPIKASYVGFFRGGEEVVAELSTNKQGEATIALVKKGTWFLYTWRSKRPKIARVSRRHRKNKLQKYESSLVFSVLEKQ